MNIQTKLEEFIVKEGVPSDEELNTLADYWEAYIVSEDPIRAQNCKKDFMMGLLIMGKRLNK